MTTDWETLGRVAQDPVSNVLKWILLAVAAVSFAILGYMTNLTYKGAPPLPSRFVTGEGTIVMSAANIEPGKAGFQKADLMDYGSLYGMGSYFGEDYTASNLVRLAQLTEENIARATSEKQWQELGIEQQAVASAVMQADLHGVDLTKEDALVPDAVAAAITTLRSEITQSLLRHDFARGWTQAYSLDETTASQTADFLIYSALTTVARRPGTDVSWTQNWPYEPLVGNTPTADTFRWTWISFCFVFFAFGAVLFIYERYLHETDRGAIVPILSTFRPLTDSQRRIGKYFLVVAGVLILTAQVFTAFRSANFYHSTFCGMFMSKRLSFGSASPGLAQHCFFLQQLVARKRAGRASLSMPCSG